jgi:hypothetical protein
MAGNFNPALDEGYFVTLISFTVSSNVPELPITLWGFDRTFGISFSRCIILG